MYLTRLTEFKKLYDMSPCTYSLNTVLTCKMNHYCYLYNGHIIIQWQTILMYVQISNLANGRSGTYGWGANIAQQTSRITKMAITQKGCMNDGPLISPT